MRRIARQDLLACGLLALPLLVGIAATRGLVAQAPAFHENVEPFYQIPAVIKLAKELPWPDIVHVRYSSPPLFQLLMAAVIRLVGYHLPLLRGLNVLFTYAATIVLYATLRRHFRLTPSASGLLAGVALLSPYFFLTGFLVLSDNFALLLCFLGVWAFLTFAETRKAWVFVAGALSVMAVLLTRHVYLWMIGFALGDLWQIRDRPRTVLGFFAVLVAAVVPLGVVFLLWGGLFPPYSQPIYLAKGLLFIKPVLFCVALWGLYALLLLPWGGLREVFVRPARPWLTAGLAVAGLTVAAFTPLVAVTGDDGYLWRIAKLTPAIGGQSVVFWVLLPVGFVAIVALLMRARHRVPWVLAFLAFAAAASTGSVPFQKYYDVLVIVSVVMLAYGYAWSGALSRRQNVAKVAAVMALFVGYAAARFAGLA